MLVKGVVVLLVSLGVEVPVPGEVRPAPWVPAPAWWDAFVANITGWSRVPQTTTDDRGAQSRPLSDEPGSWTRGWSNHFRGTPKPPPEPKLKEPFWFFGVTWSGVLTIVAEFGVYYCGTLCTTLGFAIKRVYWLLFGIAMIGLMQLTRLSYVWVLRPAVFLLWSFYRYMAGYGTWSAVRQAQGNNIFKPNWVGPITAIPWTSQYVQADVRGRGQSQKPHDLVARLRHGTIRGRTNRHGFVCKCETVHATSHRYWRVALEDENSTVHLCAADPCSSPDACAIHVLASAIVPQDQDLDVTDIANNGPLGRCCTRPLDPESEPESEGPTEEACQADQIGLAESGFSSALRNEPCQDVARGKSVQLLRADVPVSCTEGLAEADGWTFRTCERHRDAYAASRAKRGCAVEDCPELGKASPGRPRLCKLHAALEEKPCAKPSKRGKVELAPVVEAAEPNLGMADVEAVANSGPAAAGSLAEESKEFMAAFLRLALEGYDDDTALLFWDDGSKGPVEIRGILQEAASFYLARLLPGYPVSARQAILRLQKWQAPSGAEDPVLALMFSMPALATNGGSAFPPPSIAAAPLASLPAPSPAVAPWTVLHPPMPSFGQSPPQDFGGQVPTGPNALSFFRPRTSQVRPTLAPPDLRLLHAGAYSTAPQGPNTAAPVDATAKALQAIARAVSSQSESASIDRGKLGSIGREEERLVFILRACDHFTATLGPGLFLRQVKFPCNLTNRHCYGFAAVQHGERPPPDYALSVADFPRCSEEDFDTYAQTADLKIEKRPCAPTAVSQWYRAALRQAWAFACVHGQEHYPVLESAAAHLLKLSEEQSYAWPAQMVFAAWEELRGRFVEEVREIDRQLLRSTGEESPTFERMRFFATAPDAQGEPWLRLPRTFCLEDPLEYFQTDILARHGRLFLRASWNTALKKMPGLGGPAGAPKEHGRSLDQRPKDSAGKYLCWDAASHAGCPRAKECTHARKPIGYKTVDWSVQLQLLRRGGVKEDKRLTEAEALAQMASIRQIQEAKAAENVQDGKNIKAKTQKAGKLTEESDETVSGPAEVRFAPGSQELFEAETTSTVHIEEVFDSKVGEAPTSCQPPLELTSFDPTDLESSLQRLLQGPDCSWYTNVHQAVKTHAPELSELPAAAQARAATMQFVDDHPKLATVRQTDGLLGVYLRNGLRQQHEQFSSRPLGPEHVQLFLEEAVAHGCPELAEAASGMLRVDPSKVGEDQVEIGQLVWNDGVGQGPFTWRGELWKMLDFQDTLPLTALQSSQIQDCACELEPRQCLPLHVAAGILQVRTRCIPTLEKMTQQAVEATEALGVCPDHMSQAESDLRVFLHDLLHWGHDKDYRTLAACPPASLAELCLAIVRVDARRRPTVETVCGVNFGGATDRQVWLLVYKGHMRLLLPPTLRRVEPGAREVLVAGWEAHMEAAGRSEACVLAKALTICPRRPTEQHPGLPADDVFRTGKEIGAFGSATLRSPRVGMHPVAELERTDWPADAPVTDAELRAWLGEEAAAFSRLTASGQPLDFLEAKDRHYAMRVISHLKPRHMWMAFPRKTFCCWVALNSAGGADMATCREEVLLHLRFSLALGASQVQAGRKAHLENPLPSRAWKEPMAIKALADEQWLRARLDLCTTDLRGPQGGLHLSPTLVRTTDPSMQRAVNLSLQRRSTSHCSFAELITGAVLQNGALCGHRFPAEPWTEERFLELDHQKSASSLKQDTSSLEPDTSSLKQDMSSLKKDTCSLKRVSKNTQKGEGEPWTEERFAPGSSLEHSLEREEEAPVTKTGGPEEEARSTPSIRGEYEAPRPEEEARSTPSTQGSGPSGIAGEEGRKVGKCKAEEPAMLAAHHYHEWLLNNENYNQEHVARAVHLGNEVLKAAGGWQPEAEIMRKVWEARSGSHFEGLGASSLDGLVDHLLLMWQRTELSRPPHPSMNGHLQEAMAQIWKDARKGRVLLCSQSSDGLLKGVVSVPLARVPKYNPDRTLSEQGRTVWDAKQVKKGCDKGRHPPALQPRHSEVARLASKKDISDAFKWLWLVANGVRLFAADIPGLEFDLDGLITVLYLTMTFGWTGAPGEFMLYAWLLKLLHAAHEPTDPRWHDTTPYHSFYLIDDQVLLEPDLGMRPWMSVQLAEQLTRQVLGDGALNLAKDEEEGRLEDEKLIWGLKYDLSRMVRSLPPAKLEKAAYLLHLPDFDYGSCEVPLSLLQELRGNQQFWLSVMPHLAPLLGATNALLGPPVKGGKARAKGNRAAQQAAWLLFWEAVELQRVLVESRPEWATRCTHPLIAALDLAEVLSLPGVSDRVVRCSGDATLARIGAIDWTFGVAFAEDAVPLFESILAMLDEAESEAMLDAGPGASKPLRTLEEERQLIVSLTELLTVVVLASTRATAWTGRVVLYFGDNSNVIQWLASRQAGNPVARYLLQVLTAIEIVHGFHLHGVFLRTYRNVTADALTREAAGPVLTRLGLEQVQPEVWAQHLDRGWRKRALLWAHQSEADTGAALRISSRRYVTALPMTLNFSVVELFAATGTYVRAALAEGLKACIHDVSAHLAGLFPKAGLSGWPEGGGAEGTPDSHQLVLMASLGSRQGEAVKMLCELAEKHRPVALWLDASPGWKEELAVTALSQLGYTVSVVEAKGRALRDQVWWQRKVLAAVIAPARMAQLNFLAERGAAKAP
ncbi:unnamed protein product [Polarella glacialis]|uniref:Uncharacterized protein n=1 Tax=Polarella glacialis TaxID=89957 RepID=A0A813KBC4_POLGL|nr:unnamed protein product [Polarella glacialis]